MAPDLPDVNVWLALVVQEHPFHAMASRWWGEDAGDQVLFCRVTALALVRLLGQERVMGAGTLSMEQALEIYEAFSSLVEVGWAEEPTGVDALWRSLLREHRLTSRHCTDAYLAALAQHQELRLVTFDKDFQRFSQLHPRILSPGESR
jgi:toxin-antitoxin system PIN domain toxin